MKIRVKLFAGAAQLAGRDEVEVVLAAGATVAELREQLYEACPELSGLLPHLAIAVDSEYVGDDFTLDAAVEVAAIPPVSGG